MRRALTAAVLGGALALLSTAGAGAQASRARFDTRVLAHIPTPGFAALSLVGPDRSIFAGTFENPAGDSLPSKVIRFSPTGALETSYTIVGQDLSAPHGVQTAAIDAAGRLYLLDVSPPRVLRLDPRTGRQEVYATFRPVPTCSNAPPPPGPSPPGVPAPSPGPAECKQTIPDNAPEPDYAAWGPDGSMYVTDYQQGLIWKVPPGGGAARVWLSDPRFDGAMFDVAGIVLKPDHRTLLVDTSASAPSTGPNFANGKLYELPIRPDGSPGPLRQIWESGPREAPDGFALAHSGNVYMALVGPGTNQLVEIAPDGHEVARTAMGQTSSDAYAVPYDEPSSAVFDGSRLIVTNLSYVQGNTANQVLFDVWAGEPGEPVYHPPTAGVAPGPRARPSLQLAVRPRRLRAGARARLRIRVTAGPGGAPGPVAGVRLRVLPRRWQVGRDRRTGRNGRATLTVSPRRAGTLRVIATRAGSESASVSVRVLARRRHASP
ncbi:MAG TPA: hypothetical protein VGN69_03915 [Solirubrobacteraceae bacterium]|nr:hypothetical protein [Solirubrobacteraceae bacterium]